jgi:hypothetical protein
MFRSQLDRIITKVTDKPNAVFHKQKYPFTEQKRMKWLPVPNSDYDINMYKPYLRH